MPKKTGSLAAVFPGSPLALRGVFADLSRYIRAYQSGLDSALFPLGITLSLIFIGRNLVS
jgi:hypothetical protein